jgi:hypothetical protein
MSIGSTKSENIVLVRDGEPADDYWLIGVVVASLHFEAPVGRPLDIPEPEHVKLDPTELPNTLGEASRNLREKIRDLEPELGFEGEEAVEGQKINRDSSADD